jgi:hypothetical protein
MSAINFIAQSVLQDDIGGGPFSLNNQYEQLGTFRDMVYGNRINTPVGIDFCFDYRPADVHQVSIELKYKQISRQLEISSFLYHLNSIPMYAFKSRKDAYEIKLKGKKVETIVQTTKKRPIFDRMIPIDRNTSTVFLLNEDQRKSTPAQTKLMREIESALRRARIDIRRQFEDFDSLSPFRDQPQRTYLFTGENSSGVGRTGTKGISILVNDSSKRGQRKRLPDRSHF